MTRKTLKMEQVCRQSIVAYLDHQSAKDPTTAVQYWEEVFRTIGPQPRLHPFPLERQWPRTETTLTAPDHVLEAALVFAGRHGIRLDSLLYTVWAIVSTRHMAENQRTSIFAITGRDQSFLGYDTVLGPVDQDFPLVLSLPNENMDFLSWIRQVEEVAADASAHASIGFKRILETSSAVHPQVKVSIDRTSDGQNVMTADDDFSLVLNLSASRELKLNARHNLSVPRADVQALLQHVLATLEHAVENPGTDISALSIMSRAETRLLHDYGKAAFRSSSGLVHNLVEQQARLSPNADAIQYETDEPLTYSTLNRRSNQLARRIRPWGAMYVPVHMRVSANMIVALLAILKAGAAYVILDPDAPAARKSFIIEDVRAGFVLADENTAGEFPNELEHNINDLLRESLNNDDTNLATGQTPDDIAYVIYTSGSTGKPKAALLSHRAAFNGLLSHSKVENLRRLLFFNPVFSAAQRCIWATLTRGGCLCLASKDNLTVNAARTINLMQVNAVDMTSTTAALISPDKVPSLQQMALGGELVNPAVVEAWAGRVQLMSSYGLSEVTQLNWRHRLQNQANARVIGRPFDTTTAYILTPGGTELSPLLIPGELCLGGAQLARGYLNDPEETERRFIQNPFGQGRLYRTGDLAVRHADGSIELMGRSDFQVKINGQRVNPSEPNTIIQLHELVEQSAVVPAHVGNRMTLVAVIVSRAGSGTGEWESLVGQLRSSLAKRLALYMIPSFWVPMAELPLNANGKVDMRAIRDVVEGLAQSGQLLPNSSSTEIDEAVLTDNERVIRKVWADVLSIPELGIPLKHSFVALGGSSLEAIQAVSQLQSQYSLSLRVQDIILGKSLSHVASLAQHQSDEVEPGQHATSTAPFELLPESAMASLAQLGIDIAEIEDAFPVTPFQEAVVAETMMGATHYIYSRAYSFESYGPDAVKDALVSLMASNRYLRTTFFPQGMSFLQVVRKTAAVPWETSDMDLREYMQQQTSKPMHAGDLWWRAAALPGNVLVITMHHALFDYWSNEFLPQDLASVLQGTGQDKRPDLSLYVQYLNQHDEGTTRAFWEKHLLGARPTVLGNNQLGQASPDNTVSATLGLDIKQSASRLKVTPSVLLYGAWSIVLAMAGSTDDVVMGVTLSGRDTPVPGILRMAGPTLAVAPLRIKVDAANSVETHLEHVQSTLWDVARNSAYGLRNILKATRQPKDLINTTVNFLIKIPMSTQQSRGLRRLPEQSIAPPENIKLELSNDNLDQVTLSSTLDPAFAQTLVDSVAAMLQVAADAPSTKLGEFRLVPPRDQLPNGHSHQETLDLQLAESVHSESEKQSATPPESWSSASTTELFHIQSEKHAEKPGDWFSASTKGPEHELGHSAFLRIAAAYPWKTAVEDSAGDRLTYAGLGIKVNRLAGLLREKGVVLEQLIPLLLEKSINTVVAMLGVMVAGGAFLPLGPDNPRERNLGILEDSEAKLVITDRLNAHFFNDTEYEIIVMDDVHWEDIPIERQVVPGLTPDSLAYVIYTSGSTGKPKGTLLPHRALATAVEGINESMNRPSSDRVLWSQNYSFDGSFFSLFSSLASGCTLCVAPQNTILANLAELINKMRVNHVTMTPSMASLLHPDEVPTLEVLGTGGEPVSTHMLTVWAPRITVYSAYGPTEATICVTNRLVTPDLNPRNIGRPFRNVTALILDPDTMEPVSEGSVGELCVAGPHLAKGYLKRPDATEKVFHNLPSDRIYQTGDLARWLPNGEIELFGRKDDQVKINGYRVELGEVESVIMQKHLFGQCAVVAATVFKKKQLVAFHSDSVQTPGEDGGGLLLPPEHALDVDQIQDQLAELPRYMVPSIWLPVSKLPVMVSAKVDRKRLQAMAEGLEDDLLKEYLPQREASEIGTGEGLMLRSLWSLLFDVTEGEIHANTTFHELGGDSIAALNLISMLRRQGHDIKVSDILSRPTLRDQAELLALKSQLNGDDSAPLGPVERGMNYQVPDFVHDRLLQMGIVQDDVEDIYPCSPGQVEFLTQGNKNEQFWQLMAVRALPVDFDLDHWVGLTTTLTERNPILRTIYVYPDDVNKDPQRAVQVVLKSPALNLDHKSYDTEDQKQRILEAEWEARFDPAKPFVRYSILVNTQDGSRSLAIKLDHASYDGTLLHIFDDQFKALHRNQPILDHTPFRDFIAHVASTPKQPQLDYWMRQLRHCHFDFPAKVAADPTISRSEVARVSASTAVDALAMSSGVTVPIVFQTAYSLLLAHLSGSRDVVYDNLVAGRNVPLDNPQLINGNLANFLPFHSHVAGGGSDGDDLTIERLLQDTQTAFWEATENGLVSLGEIYEALGRDRSTAAAKCLFVFQPFEAVPAAEHQDHMRWIVMKMSKNTMYFNYALQVEVVKAESKGEYVVRFLYDERAFSAEEAQAALRWYINCLEGMGNRNLVEELGI
ncbi:hypothetical protein ACRALDRAFT_1078267 [Sodiomyces alcalophilus JCM 7366]|uniref:uncharacterized protein n=1 Tax=Sodiomyces alcalophilus JCM 7366 TaxID=591952 RepID=UPI0039B482B6